MTDTDVTESDFQAMLDADPSNSGLRLAFSDWLEDQGDERAEGYREIGEKGYRPRTGNRPSGPDYTAWWTVTSGNDRDAKMFLEPKEHDWSKRVGSFIPLHLFKKLTDYYEANKLTDGPTAYKQYRSRRLAEDSFALAFAAVQREQAKCKTCGGSGIVEPRHNLKVVCPDCSEAQRPIPCVAE